MSDHPGASKSRRVLGVWLVGRTGFENYLPEGAHHSQSDVSTIIARCETADEAVSMAKQAMVERFGEADMPDEDWFDFVMQIAEGPAEKGVFFYVGLANVG